MKRIGLITMLFFLFTSFMVLNAQWARTYGGYDRDNATSIQQTSDGGYILVGSSSSFGAIYDNIWVLKLSSTGTIDWQYTYGGGNWDVARSIQQTSDGGYIVTGYTWSFGAGEKDIWVLKLSSTGTIDWQYTYGGGRFDDDPSIQQTSDGGYIVTGYTSSFVAGAGDIWVLKLFSTGTIDWQHTYGGGDFDSDPSIQQTSDGGYIVAGSTSSFGAGKRDIWVLKLSSTGTIDWQHTYGGSYSDYDPSIQQTSDGGYIVAGSSNSFAAGVGDIWVLKLSSTGTIDWQRTYGGSSSDFAQSIQQTSDVGYIVAGSTYSFGAGENDIWVLKLSSTGTIDWQRTYGGGGFDDAKSIQQTSDGGYIVAGSSNSFGAGEFDFLVLKLNSDGDIDPHCGFIGTSNASVLYTAVSPVDTNITPEDTLIIPSDTSIFPQPSDAIVTFLCQEYILTISATTGGTTNPAPGTYTHDPGAQVSVQALPSSRYQFSDWSGDASGTTNPITITMDSDKSVTANFTAIPSGDGDGDGGGGGLCFLATAAYGSPLHPHVKILRDFRDKYLMPNTLGRNFVYVYYKYSPFVANIVTKHKVLKIATRIYLLPVIVFCYSMLHVGPAATLVIFIIIFPILIILYSQRRQTKNSIKCRKDADPGIPEVEDARKRVAGLKRN